MASRKTKGVTKIVLGLVLLLSIILFRLDTGNLSTGAPEPLRNPDGTQGKVVGLWSSNQSTIVLARLRDTCLTIEHWRPDDRQQPLEKSKSFDLALLQDGTLTLRALVAKSQAGACAPRAATESNGYAQLVGPPYAHLSGSRVLHPASRPATLETFAVGTIVSEEQPREIPIAISDSGEQFAFALDGHLHVIDIFSGDFSQKIAGSRIRPLVRPRASSTTVGNENAFKPNYQGTLPRVEGIIFASPSWLAVGWTNGVLQVYSLSGSTNANVPPALPLQAGRQLVAHNGLLAKPNDNGREALAILRPSTQNGRDTIASKLLIPTTGRVWGLSFSPQGGLLVTSRSGYMEYWTGPQGKDELNKVPDAHQVQEGTVQAVAFIRRPPSFSALLKYPESKPENLFIAGQFKGLRWMSWVTNEVEEVHPGVRGVKFLTATTRHAVYDDGVMAYAIKYDFNLKLDDFLVSLLAAVVYGLFGVLIASGLQDISQAGPTIDAPEKTSP